MRVVIITITIIIIIIIIIIILFNRPFDSIDKDGYKYLDVLEVDDIMYEVGKTNMKEYIRRVKKNLTSKLKGGNVIKAINSWAV